MKPFRSEFLVLRGRRIHVRHWGTPGAPLLVMLHGWGDVSATFQFVVDALRGPWHVVAPDWRGFGLSQWNQGSYWFADYLADLDALLDHYTPDAPARIVAHSMGGNVAGLYAGARPDRVAGLLNMEGFGLRVSEAATAPDRYGKWLAQAGREEAFRPYPDRRAFEARLQRENPRLSAGKAEFLAQHLMVETEGGYRFAADPCHRWVNPVLYRLDEAKACWRRIRAPVMWLAAPESPIMKEFIGREQDYRDRLACFAHGQEVVLADSGHNMHHDRPEAVAALIEGFFS